MLSQTGYIILESAVVLLFLLTFHHAWHKGRAFELLSAVIYGLMLEEGDILIFGTYGYSNLFLLKIHQVPVTIALCWAMILYTAMRLSDALDLPEKVKPFFDAVQGIVMDLSFDAIAIRIGLWHWIIPMDAGWFGVPAGNFYAWLCVILVFSFITRYLRKKIGTWGSLKEGLVQMAVPLLAYPALLVSFVPFFAYKFAVYGPHSQRGEGMELFLLALLVFTGASLYGYFRKGKVQRYGPGDLVLILPRLMMHLFFIMILLRKGIYLQIPILLGVSLLMLILDLAFHLPVLRQRSSSDIMKMSKME